ncbi:MAG: DUF484 family protein, partial [Pseudomonadota bacterium]
HMQHMREVISDDGEYVVADDFPHMLHVEWAALAVEGNASEAGQQQRLRLLPSGGVDKLIGPGAQEVLRPVSGGSANLFGASHGDVRSEALLRLTFAPSAPPGVLAFASRDPNGFGPDQGRDLLRFLARAVERAVALWLDLPPN